MRPLARITACTWIDMADFVQRTKIPITDFPDIRMRCAIHSANSGSLMVIPRENKLVRLYIQLTTTEKIDKAGEGGAKADRSKINPDVSLGAAQRIIAPYKLTYRVLDWVRNREISAFNSA